MQHLKTRKPERPSRRSERASLSPYVLDDVTLTLSEIREARSGVRHSMANR